MAQSGGISGLAVAVATVGGLLVYAGFRGVNPVQALKDVTSGKAPAVSKSSAGLGAAIQQSAYVTSGSSGTSGLAGGTHPEIASAALQRTGEIYSQAKRWAAGYSDCSSFVGKCLKDCGITPPGASVTMSYRTWTRLKTISRAEIGAGDLLCGTGHIAIALNSTTAIGQQRTGVNVKIGPIDDIMYGQVGWVPRRYVGGSALGGGSVAA